MKKINEGDKIYWKTMDGNIKEDTCISIEEDPEGQIEPMYFTYVSQNGGGTFVTESDLLDPESQEVKLFKINNIDKKIKNFFDDEMRDEIFGRLRDCDFDYETTKTILNVIINGERT